MVFLSPLGWVLFLPVFVKIQLTVLYFPLRREKKKKDSLPLSVMETYTAYSKSAHNVKTNILVQKMIFSVTVRGLTGSKWK